MGWTSYHASFYKNGKIDRKAECDSIMNCDMVGNKGRYIGRNEEAFEKQGVCDPKY